NITSFKFIPDIGSEELTLFPNNVLVEFDQFTASPTKLFEAVHLGVTTVQIIPTDATISPVTVNVNVYPSTLGLGEAVRDDLINTYANIRGLPPQLIKAVIRQEGASSLSKPVDKNAFRYEPGFDWSYVQNRN